MQVFSNVQTSGFQKSAAAKYLELFCSVQRLNFRLIKSKNIMTNKILAFALASSVSLVALTAAADDAVDLSKLPPASDKKGVTYENDIKPIFDKHCFKCHGEEKQKGKLRLDSLDAVLKGSKDEDIGQVVKKGDSAHSTLVQAVARITPDEDDAMPPAKRDGTVDALSKEEVGLIRAWIDQGAK